MPFSHVLCAADFTPSAREALNVASELARRGSSLDICHVLERDRLAAEVGDLPGADRLLEELAAQAEHELEVWRRDVAETVPSASVHTFGAGRPAEEIANAARRFGSDLIVVGAGSRQHGLLGSTAERIVRHAPCSVLVVAGEGRLPKSLLCAVDFSATAREAMGAAADLAASDEVKLALAHALGLSDIDLPWFAVNPAFIADARKRAESSLRRWALEAELRVGRPVPSQVLDGRVVDTLLAAARDGGHDWLVTGSHGRTGIARALLGSVAERLVRRADRPVLVVRAARPN